MFNTVTRIDCSAG